MTPPAHFAGVGRTPHSRTNRGAILVILAAAFALVTGLVVLATPASAQGTSRALLDSLEAARKQRLALEAALERELAAGIAERAKNLAMGDEAAALQRLEALLDSAQARLRVQRDRIRVLRDASTVTEKAILVVLLRAEDALEGDLNAVLVVDEEQHRFQAMTADLARSLRSGAADELYRGEVAPVEHKVSVTVTGRGFTAGETLTVTSSPREVRYVEFVLRGGRLVPTTWTNRSAR